jgi:alpha-ribazole phosphatase
MALILLRHGRPAGGEGICYGRSDLPCGPDHDGLAADLAARLPALASIATSPLVRCRQLAEAIAAAQGLPLALDPDLVEIDFGRWEGVAWDAVPRHELDLWARDLIDARPHGGESVRMLLARAERALARWREAAPPVLLVTHAGFIRAALALAGDPDPWTRAIAHASWITLSGRRGG